MTSRSRMVLLTAALLAAAGGAVLWARLGVAGRDDAARARRAAEARLFDFQAAQVKAVVLAAKGETTRLVRSGDGWRIEAPRPGPADRFAVDALVDRVASLRRKADLPGGAAEPARFGLDRPRARVELTLDDGRVETLAVGDDNPFDGSLPVCTGSGAVALVGGELRWVVERGAVDLAERPRPAPDPAGAPAPAPTASPTVAPPPVEGRPTEPRPK